MNYDELCSTSEDDFEPTDEEYIPDGSESEISGNDLSTVSF